LIIKNLTKIIIRQSNKIEKGFIFSGTFKIEKKAIKPYLNFFNLDLEKIVKETPENVSFIHPPYIGKDYYAVFINKEYLKENNLIKKE